MEYMVADKKNPNMGLNNRICKNPKYWCRLHMVWLSEEDVEKKQCKAKPDIWMLGTERCTNLVEKKYVENVN